MRQLQQSFGRRVCVVGSAPTLIGQGYGEEINSYDSVVRFNRASTEGREKDIGSKTTHYCINQPTLMCRFVPVYERQQDGVDKDFVKQIRNKHIIVHRFGSLEYKKLDTSNTVHRADFSSRSIADKQRAIGVENPLVEQHRTGFSMVVLLCWLGFKPSLYGFGLDTPSQNKYYWSGGNGPHTEECLSREAEVLVHMYDSKLIHIQTF